MPIVLPPGAHAVFLDAKRFLPHVAADATSRRSRSPPRSTSPAASARWSAGSSRASTDDDPYDGLELVRLTLPRRVYTQEHLDYVAEVVADLHAHARRDPGPAR